MDIPEIKTSPPVGKGIDSLSKFLRVSGEWHKQHLASDAGMLSNLWYRGTNTYFDAQRPGVYRDKFTSRAAQINIKGDIEEKRLRLERDMISNFRSAGAAFHGRSSPTEIYFLAQHFGMPTRLLDWSTNPLAALFFACEGEDNRDGFVYAMDARFVIPEDAKKDKGEKLWPSVMLMHNPLVKYAVEVSFWSRLNPKQAPYILPVRPDTIPGRIGQQSSCFTFHMHLASPVENRTMTTIKVNAASKGSIRDELHSVNINQFTSYYDLDHLSKEIKRGWGLAT